MAGTTSMHRDGTSLRVAPTSWRANERRLTSTGIRETMTDDRKTAVLTRLEALRTALEGRRFAAFTLTHLLERLNTSLRDDTRRAFQELKVSLEAAEYVH